MTETDWQEANQRYLIAHLDRLRATLQRHAGEQVKAEPDTPEPPALRHLIETFGLSDFERDVLLLCAGCELEGDFAGLCAAAQAAPRARVSHLRPCARGAAGRSLDRAQP